VLERLSASDAVEALRVWGGFGKVSPGSDAPGNGKRTALK